jgi:aminoglycoside/choline kinase family phosphotransferase
VGNGLLLIEDLGDDTYTKIFARADGAAERELYALAVDLLADLHRRDLSAVLSALPDYDDERLLAEAALLVDWYPRMTGATPSPCAANTSICGKASFPPPVPGKRPWSCAISTWTI